ncbi:MAG: hypothetical protein WED34_04280 [Planctomycetales bacterium]
MATGATSKRHSGGCGRNGEGQYRRGYYDGFLAGMEAGVAAGKSGRRAAIQRLNDFFNNELEAWRYARFEDQDNILDPPPTAP